MRKLLLGLAIGLLSFSSYSSELKCSESYDIFQGIISGAVEVRRRYFLRTCSAYFNFGASALFKRALFNF